MKNEQDARAFALAAQALMFGFQAVGTAAYELGHSTRCERNGELLAAADELEAAIRKLRAEVSMARDEADGY